MPDACPSSQEKILRKTGSCDRAGRPQETLLPLMLVIMPGGPPLAVMTSGGSLVLKDAQFVMEPAWSMIGLPIAPMAAAPAETK